MSDEQGKTFTQDELNAIVANEKRALTAKFEEEKSGLAKQIEETLKDSESHKAAAAQSTQRVEEMQAALDAKDSTLLKYKVGTEAGLPAAVIGRLQGDDEEALAKDAATLSELLKKPGDGEGRLAGGPKGDPPKQDENDMNARIRAAAGKG